MIPYFVIPTIYKFKHGVDEYINNPVNLALCISMEKTATLSGLYEITFWMITGKVLWTFPTEANRDEEMTLIIKNAWNDIAYSVYRTDTPPVK
jgi:hypothetical protein